MDKNKIFLKHYICHIVKIWKYHRGDISQEEFNQCTQNLRSSFDDAYTEYLKDHPGDSRSKFQTYWMESVKSMDWKNDPAFDDVKEEYKYIGERWEKQRHVHNYAIAQRIMDIFSSEIFNGFTNPT